MWGPDPMDQIQAACCAVTANENSDGWWHQAVLHGDVHLSLETRGVPMVVSCTCDAGGIARRRFRGRRLRRGGYEDERQLQLSGANLNKGFIILPSRVRGLAEPKSFGHYQCNLM